MRGRRGGGIVPQSAKGSIEPVVSDSPAAAHGVVTRKLLDASMMRKVSADATRTSRTSTSVRGRGVNREREKAANQSHAENRRIAQEIGIHRLKSVPRHDGRWKQSHPPWPLRDRYSPSRNPSGGCDWTHARNHSLTHHLTFRHRSRARTRTGGGGSGALRSRTTA
jgi:hypothetical protein